MEASHRGLELIAKWEGFVPTAYVCPGGVWTIGYGHTGGVKEGDVISEGVAALLLSRDVAGVENGLNRLKLKLNQNQFDALVSFIYNIGIGNFRISTILKHLEKKEYTKASEQFGMWKYSNHRILSGLVKRREEEKELFLTPLD